MLRIRLRRVGKTKRPHYRMVVADKPDKRDGDFIELVGSYDPHAEPPKAEIKVDRVREWLAKGAQPSEAAAKILRREGVIEGPAVAAPVVVAAPAAKGGRGKAATAAAAAAAPSATPAKAVAAVEEPAAPPDEPAAAGPTTDEEAE
jgi:small subunit ribosomal protein S16